MSGNLSRKAEQSFRMLKKRVTQRINALGGVGDKRVLFVAGVQRSGTNMLMNVLERSTATDVFHEVDPRAYKDYELMQDLVPQLIETSAAPFIVIKVLCELHDLRDLLDAYPGSRGVWIYRRYDDVVNSHIVKWNGMPDTVHQIVADGREAAGWRGRGMSDASLKLLNELHHPALDNPSACALFWMWRNQLFFDLALDQDERMRLINYETFVSNPAGHFPAIFEFFNLEYRTEHSSFVTARSIGKAAAPDISADVRKHCDALFERLDAASWKL